jgi:hypothetical protein
MKIKKNTEGAARALSDFLLLATSPRCCTERRVVHTAGAISGAAGPFNHTAGLFDRMADGSSHTSDYSNHTAGSSIQALGIEGTQQTGPELTVIQPVIDAVTSGNHVNVKWGWGGNGAYLDMCELQVERGDGKGFVLLAFDTTPNYTDTQPFPAPPVTWIYRAIYRVADDRIGQWSLPVSVTVTA